MTWPNGKRLKKGKERLQKYKKQIEVKKGERAEQRIKKLTTRAERAERLGAAEQRLVKAKAARPPTYGERAAKGILAVAAKQARKAPRRQPTRPRKRAPARELGPADPFGLLGPPPRRGRRGGGDGDALLKSLTR